MFLDVSFGKEADANLTGPLSVGASVIQEFIAEYAHLESIKVFLATYKRSNRGFIKLELFDEIGNKIGESSELNMESIRDNSWQKFDIRTNLILGMKYSFHLVIRGILPLRSVTAKWGRNKHENKFVMNSKIISNGELSCVFRYITSSFNEINNLQNEVLGLISVIIPHFRCADYIRDCLESLWEQSYSGIEVIVVDDGSPDVLTTKSIVNEYKGLYSRLEFVTLPENRGAPVARNVGASMSKGEYLFFLDADCVLYRFSLEKLITSLLENPKASFSYGGFRWGKSVIMPRDFDLDLLRERNYISTMSLVRRKVFPGFDETLKRHQDWDLWLVIANKGGFGVCVGDLLFETPMRVNSISSENNISMTQSMRIVRRKHRQVEV